MQASKQEAPLATNAAQLGSKAAKACSGTFKIRTVHLTGRLACAAALLHRHRVWQATDIWAAGNCVTPQISDPASHSITQGKGAHKWAKRSQSAIPQCCAQPQAGLCHKQGTKCPQCCLLSRWAPGDGFISILHPLEGHNFCLHRNMLPQGLGYKHVNPTVKKPCAKEEWKQQLWKERKIKAEW